MSAPPPDPVRVPPTRRAAPAGAAPSPVPRLTPTSPAGFGSPRRHRPRSCPAPPRPRRSAPAAPPARRRARVTRTGPTAAFPASSYPITRPTSTRVARASASSASSSPPSGALVAVSFAVSPGSRPAASTGDLRRPARPIASSPPRPALYFDWLAWRCSRPSPVSRCSPSCPPAHPLWRVLGLITGFAGVVLTFNALYADHRRSMTSSTTRASASGWRWPASCLAASARSSGPGEPPSERFAARAGTIRPMDPTQPTRVC